MEEFQYFPGLENFDVTKPESFKMWLERFEILVLSRINEANLTRSKSEQISASS